MRIELFVTCFVSTLYYIANGPLVNTLRAGNVVNMVNIRKCVPAFIGYHVDVFLYLTCPPGHADAVYTPLTTASWRHCTIAHSKGALFLFQDTSQGPGVWCVL